MVDISAIPTNVNSISNIILVTPQENSGISPQQKPGQQKQNQPESILFHTIGEEFLNLTSDITDHFVEGNTAIQDQIALKPEIYTVEGYIGELNNVTPKALIPLKTAADKLSTLSPFVPAISSAAQIAYNNADQAYRVAELAVGAAVSAWNTISNSGSKNPIQNKQQNVFNRFYGYYLARQLFTVQTPWNKLSDMAILSLKATQDADTRVITGFSVTFKKIRFAKPIVSVPKAEGRAAAASATLQDKGPSTTTPVGSVTDEVAARGILP